MQENITLVMWVGLIPAAIMGAIAAYARLHFLRVNVLQRFKCAGPCGGGSGGGCFCVFGGKEGRGEAGRGPRDWEAALPEVGRGAEGGRSSS